MAKVLIADDVAEECARVLRQGGLEVDFRGRLGHGELIRLIESFDGLIVRSGVHVSADIIEAGKSLKLIGRAGIGVDNIDQEAATRRGIIVMNAPLGNVTSAAEHAFALMMTLARNISRADADLRGGHWERHKFLGVELEGKTLGIVGLGKVGAQVSRYAQAFGMRVIAYDPHLVREKAEVLGVQLVQIDVLLEQSDFITLHLPLNERTQGMFGSREFRKMKKTVRLVNDSRGGIIDERALAEAIQTRQIAGAALDVFDQEPLPAGHPLLTLPEVVLTPHLGASTEEAQVKVSIDIARQFVEFFTSGVVKNAVNLATVSDPALAPYMRLAEDLGLLNTQLGGGRVRQIEVTFMGEIARFETGAIAQAAVKGVLQPISDERLNVVNARLFAKERGISVLEHHRKDARNFKNLVTVCSDTEAGRKIVSGTVFESKEPRIVQIDGYDIDLRPSKYMLALFYPDIPGMVGKFGTILGRHNINIARMEVGRQERGKQAVMVLTLDDPVTPPILEEIRGIAGMEDVRSIVLS